MNNGSQIQMRSLSDNRASGARKIGTLNGSKAFAGSVGVSDRIDFYSFKVTNRSSFSLSLTKLKNNVDVFLLKGTKTIARSVKRGKTPEAITTTLAPGTYFIRVAQKSGNSPYRLGVRATPSPVPIPTPGSRKLVSLAAQASSTVPRYGLIDLSTGNISTLPQSSTIGQLTLVDIAASGNDAYAIDLLSGLHRVDPTTGAAITIGDLGGFLSNTAFISLGFGPGGALYTVGTNKTTRLSALYTVNVSTGGNVTLVANLPGIVDVGDIAYDPASNRFFASGSAASASSSILYAIGLNGSVQQIGNIGFAGVNALFFDNGILYGYDSSFSLAQKQLIINTTTGAGQVDKSVSTNNQPGGTISGGA